MADTIEVNPRMFVRDFTGEIAARCQALGKFHGDPADRIITATALVHGLIIVTRAEKNSRHPGVKTLWD